MLNIKTFTEISLGLFLTFAALDCSAAAFTKVHDTTGDSITVWDAFTPTGFNIFAVTQITNTWNPSLTIADPLTSPSNPIASINASDNVVAIWSGFDVVLGTRALYSAVFVGGVWQSPVQLSDPTSENLMDGYQVTIADNDVTVVSWTSYSLISPAILQRGVYSSTPGVWGSSITF